MKADHPRAKVDGPLPVLCGTGGAVSWLSEVGRAALLSVPSSDRGGPATPGEERMQTVWTRVGGAGGLDCLGWSERGIPGEVREPPQARKLD